MADLPQQNTIIQYVADGIETNYVVPFYTPIETDGTPNIDVFAQAAAAQPIPENDIKEWNVDYTYTPNLDPITGGIVTFLPGKIPPNGYIVTIVRDVSASLDVEFAQAATFSGFTLDAALDKLLLISQQNKSYTLGRNLSYIINSYIPESTISANVQIPPLGAEQIWIGSADGVIAATLEQPADVSTLRSQLANEAPTTNGAALVGFYDETNLNPTNVADQLNLLTAGLSAAIPPGFMMEFGGAVAPAGFAPCNGQLLSRAVESNLFAAIGTTWGAGDGTTTFNAPNLNGFGTAGAGGNLFAVLPAVDQVGESGGEKTYAILTANLPPHNHAVTYTYQFPGIVNSGAISGYSVNAGTSQQISNSVNSGNGPGTSVPFSLIQPTKIVLKCIKL